MCVPRLAVGLQREQRGGQHREGEQHQHAGEQDVPGEDRHPEHGHAGGAHADDRGDEVHRAEDRAQTRKARPMIHRSPPMPGRERSRPRAARRRTSRSSAAPPGVKNPASTIRPPNRNSQYAEHVQPGEGHVRRADLQRHERVREPGEQRRREQEQHDRAVHGEQLVVGARWSSAACPGRVNSARITSAMTPAIRKNANEVIRYMYPITL